MKKILLIILLIMNAMVLTGQLWPQGAPPFAHTVNVLFLSLSLIYFISQLASRKK